MRDPAAVDVRRCFGPSPSQFASFATFAFGISSSRDNPFTPWRASAGAVLWRVMTRPAVFLDRDDTLIENHSLPREAWAGGKRGDLCDPAYVRPLPGAVEACQILVRAGYCLVVVSNQGLVARGHGTIEQVEATNAAMRRVFTDEHGHGLLAAVYYCPFHPEGRVKEFTREHPWRKPGAGMIVAAAAAFGLDLERSWVVGDKERDVEAGRRAGVAEGRLAIVTESRSLGDLARRIVASSE